MLQDFISPVDN